MEIMYFTELVGELWSGEWGVGKPTRMNSKVVYNIKYGNWKTPTTVGIISYKDIVLTLIQAFIKTKIWRKLISIRHYYFFF